MIRSVLLAIAVCLAAGSASAAQLLTRTLQDRPAVVLTAFGTSTKAEVTYRTLETQVRAALPDHEVRWAFTSEVIRERVNTRRARHGRAGRLSSLAQVLADLEAAGFTKAAVQPIHIFPGEEYEEVLATVRHFPGLRVETGETLLQRWETVHEVVEIVSADFLPAAAGCNVVVAHGTPSTHVGSNITLLGLDRLLSRSFDNVLLGAVDGIITPEDALGPARRCLPARVRMIPLMYVAGDHIMNDIMGQDGESSWREQLEAAGVAVEVTQVEYEDRIQAKGLGFYPAVNAVFVNEILRTLGRL